MGHVCKDVGGWRQGDKQPDTHSVRSKYVLDNLLAQELTAKGSELNELKHLPLISVTLCCSAYSIQW